MAELKVQGEFVDRACYFTRMQRRRVVLFAILLLSSAYGKPKATNSLEYSLDAGYRLNGKEWLAVQTLEHNYRFTEDYSLQTQLKFHTNLERDEDTNEWNEDFKHRFLRVRLRGPTFAEVLGFRTKWTLQYKLPTTEESQKAGSYGALGVRFYFEKQLSELFNLSIVPIVEVALNRNGYQVNSPKKKRNELGSAHLNLVPQLVLGQVTLTYDAIFGVVLDGHSAKENNVQSSAVYEGDLELLRNFSSLGDLALGLFYYHSFAFGKGTKGLDSKGQFIHSSESYAGVRLIKAIDF